MQRFLFPSPTSELCIRVEPRLHCYLTFFSTISRVTIEDRGLPADFHWPRQRIYRVYSHSPGWFTSLLRLTVQGVTYQGQVPNYNC